MIHIRAALLGLLCVLSTLGSPAQTRNSKTSTQPAPVERKQVTQIELQSAVMDLADDYIAVLGEATYLMLRDEELSSRGRWLSQSFLRNGVGASVDIASGPNPEVALLDLLVLASLQAWAFEKHWMPQGFPDGSGKQALQHLKETETALWGNATRFLSVTQIESLRLLVSKWIEAHPEQTVVSFVRFDEFTNARRAGSTELHQRAWGLLSDLSKATVQVDAARLLGERMLWFAGRYPYILGEQSELTAYRLAASKGSVLNY